MSQSLATQYAAYTHVIDTGFDTILATVAAVLVFFGMPAMDMVLGTDSRTPDQVFSALHQLHMCIAIDVHTQAYYGNPAVDIKPAHLQPRQHEKWGSKICDEEAVIATATGCMQGGGRERALENQCHAQDRSLQDSL